MVTDDFGIITIMYHRFEENKYPSTNIRINDFKEHIELIKKVNIKFKPVKGADHFYESFPNEFEDTINEYINQTIEIK